MIAIIGLSVAIGALFSTAAFSSNALAVGNDARRPGSTISGFVFDLRRQPISQVTVELLDDFSPAAASTKTNAIGQYVLSGLTTGRFRIRVLPAGFEEQEQEIEIQSSYENIQKDFYLKPRKNNQLNPPEAIFVQEVPKPAREIYKKAVKSLGGGKKEQGLKNLESVVEVFPDYYDAVELLGTEYIKLKNYEAAEILLRRAVEINPRGSKSWYGLAYAFYSQNKRKQALEAAEKASFLNPLSVEAPFLAGVLLRQAGRYDESEKQLKRARDLSRGRVAEVHWQLALLYGNSLNRYREAADALEAFLKIRGDTKELENIKKLIVQFKEKSQK